MAWQLSAYVAPPLLAAAVSALLAAYVWRRRSDPLSRAFLALLVAIGAWSLAYAVQLSRTTLAEQLLWQRIGLAIGAAIPTIWLVFALVYAGDQHRLTRPVLGLLLVDPVGFAVLAWTNGSHGLLWSSASLARGPGLELTFTPLYLVHITYAYLLVLAGIGILAAVFVRSSAIYRRQAGLLVAGAVVPLLANVAFTVGATPVPGLDLTTTTFAATGVVFALALFRFDLLDLTPVARRRVLDEFGDGVLVADDRGRLVHVNEVARAVLPRARIGTDVTEVLDVADVDEVDGHILTHDGSVGRRFFEFGASTLRDFRGREAGHVLALRDVTETVEREQRLQVANRLLRHNLRNDMNKIGGWAESLREEVDGEALEAVERIQSVAHDVGELSREARRIEDTLEASDRDPVTVDLPAVLRSVVADAREAWPDAEIALSAPDAASVRATDAVLLATAFRNLVENAIEHNDRPRPRVDVTVREDGDMTAVSVADDGPGIPAMERSVLRARGETPLRHGSGLGLWVVRWIVRAGGGSLEVAGNEPRGSVVTVRLRPA